MKRTIRLISTLLALRVVRACENRTVGCSGHGDCWSGFQCVCDTGYVLPDCSASVLGTTWARLYQGYYWTLLICASLLTGATGWRAAIVWHSKRGPDGQVATLVALTLAVALMMTGHVDVLGAEGLMKQPVAHSFIDAGDTCALVAATLAVRFFMGIVARFHAPTRLYLRWLHGWLALGASLLLASIVWAYVVPRAGSLAFALLAALCALLVFVGFSLYVLVVVSPMRGNAEGQLHRHQLRRLVRLVRGIQVVLILTAVASLLGVLYTPAYDTVVGMLVWALVSRLIILGGCAGLLLLLGRRQREERTVVPGRLSSSVAQLPLPLSPAAATAAARPRPSRIHVLASHSSTLVSPAHGGHRPTLSSSLQLRAASLQPLAMPRTPTSTALAPSAVHLAMSTIHLPASSQSLIP